MPLFGRKKKAKASDKDSRNETAKRGKNEKRATPVISNPLVDTATQSDFPPLPSSSQYTAAKGLSASGLQDACDPGYCVITQHGWQEDSLTANDTQITVEVAPEDHTQLQVSASHSSRASPSTARADRAEARATPRESEGGLSALPSVTSLPGDSEDSFFLKTPREFPHEGSPNHNVFEGGGVYSQVRKKSRITSRSRDREAISSFGCAEANKCRTRKRSEEADEYGRNHALDFHSNLAGSTETKGGRVSPQEKGDKKSNNKHRSPRRDKTFRNKTFPGDHFEDSDDSGEENEVDGDDWSEEDFTLSSDMSQNDKPEHTKHQSSGYPSHRPPSSGKRKKGDESPLCPVIQPETIAPLSPLSPYAPPYDTGYVFTKRQPDGSLQYYSATPVMSPTTSTPASPLLRPSGNMSEHEAFYFPTPPRLSSSWPYLAAPVQNGHLAYGSGQPFAVAPATYRGLGTPQQAAHHSQPIFCAPTSASSLSNPWFPARSHLQPFSAPSLLPQQPSATPHTPPIGHRVSSPPRPIPRKPKDTSGGGKGSGTQPPATQDRKPQGEGQAAQDGEEIQTESKSNDTHPANRVQQEVCAIDSSKLLGSEIEGKLKCLEQDSCSLKETVLKLTNELSKHSFKPTTPGENRSSISGELAEKNDVITNLKKEILQLKDEIARLLKDNQELTANLRSLEESSTVTGEWQELVERAEQVTAENVSLQRQQELQNERMEELKKEHLVTVSQLNTELSRSKKERQVIERELRAQKVAHTQLQEKLNSVVTMSTGRVSMEEHREALEEFQRLVDGLAEKSEEDSRTQGHQLKALQKDKKSLVTKLTDAKAVIVQLEEECASLQKSNRKAQEKIADLQQALEESRDREVAAHVHLSNLVMQAEKAVAERDTFARIVKYQQKHGEEEMVSSGHRGVKAKKKSQPWDSSDRTVRCTTQGHGESTEGSYQDDLQYLRSLLRQNKSDLAACVGNVQTH